MTQKSIYKILLTFAFIIILIFGIKLLFTPTFVATDTPGHELHVSSLIIQFKDGITEQESREILENYNLTAYKIDYNVHDMGKYYITVNKDEATQIKYELRKEKNWIGVTPDVEKGNYCMISISEQAIQDKNFIEMLNKRNLQVKKFFWCRVIFTDHTKNGISQENANELRNRLEKTRIFSLYSLNLLNHKYLKINAIRAL